jgi:hypothetical protein
MLSPARSPLGAPGAFALPDATTFSLHPQRMDVCAFAGVAPRGPARMPVVDVEHPSGPEMVGAAWPLRRSVPVLVRSFDEYVRTFGGYEGPGLLPHAVASYFEQGGRLAWIVRIVPSAADPFAARRSAGVLSGAFTKDIAFLARDEGTWGDGLSVKSWFTATPLAFTTLPDGRMSVEPRAPAGPGVTLRLFDADGHATFAVCESTTRVRDAARARDRLALDLDAVPPNPTVRAEVVEACLEIDDGAGRRERFERLALAPAHPQSVARVLCDRSGLVWPREDWATTTLVPADTELELLTAGTAAFAGGADEWEKLVPEDFFDPKWSAASEEPGDGIAAAAGLDQATQLVLPDLYLPAQWAGEETTEPVTSGGAGAEFGECVGTSEADGVTSVPPSLLVGLVIDPRTSSGLDAIAALHQRVIDVCEDTKNLVALLDVPPGMSQGRIEDWRARFDTSYAAAYHPWLVPGRRNDEDTDPALARERRLPPSAVAAGVIARRELERGIQYGPANEIARQVVHVAESQPEGRADALHPLGINCFVREPGGIALVAARTLSRESDWRQLSVRRLILMLRRTLLAETQWAVFEPNGPELWRDLERAIDSLLRGLFLAGAFAGRTEAESFFVRMHTEEARLSRGELLVEIGVAPAEPLEFILVRLRREGDGTLNLED